MSSFKIEKMKSSLLPAAKRQGLEIQKKSNSNNVQFSISQMGLLNYQIDQILVPIQLKAENKQVPTSLLRKSLKIITVSLNDKELFSKIQSIFQRKNSNNDGIFKVLSQWTEFVNIYEILNKFSQKVKNKLLIIIFSKIFLRTSRQNNKSQGQIKKQIAYISSKLTQNEKKQIIYQLQNQIELKKDSFSHDQFLRAGQKILNYIDQHNNSQIKKLFSTLGQIFFTLNEVTLVEIIKKALTSNQRYRGFIQRLFLVSESIKSKIIISMSNEMNKLNVSQVYQNFKGYFDNQTVPSQFFVSSFRHWINQNLTSNSQKIVSEIYRTNLQEKQSVQRRIFVIKIFKYVEDQATFKKMIEAKSISCFFRSNKYFFQKECFLIKQQIQGGKHQHTEFNFNIYKSMKNCRNFGKTNVLLLSKSDQIQYWPKLNNIQKISLGNSKLNSRFQQFLTDLKAIEDNLLKQNKAIKICYLVVEVQIQGKKYFLALSQLQKIINFQLALLKQDHFLEQYGIAKNIQKQLKKQVHPIINQAKVVKLLKKAQKGLSIIQIANILDIKIEECQILINKLTNKGYIQAQQKNSKYIYLP